MTKRNIDKFVENRTSLQKAKFNSTISSVNIGVQETGFCASPIYNVNQNSFLPTMPFKQSNFAKTHKAIKQMREAPHKRRKRQESLSGQFIRLNDYQAMHGQNAGDSRVYLQPEETTIENGSKERENNKMMYSVTHSSIEDNTTSNNQNYNTSTSFGKQGSLLKGSQRETAVNTS